MRPRSSKRGESIPSNENAAECIQLCRVFLFELFESIISPLTFQHSLDSPTADSAEVQAAASHLFPASNAVGAMHDGTQVPVQCLPVIFLGDKPGRCLPDASDRCLPHQQRCAACSRRTQSLLQDIQAIATGAVVVAGVGRGSPAIMSQRFRSAVELASDGRHSQP